MKVHIKRDKTIIKIQKALKGEFDDQSNKKICFSKNFMKFHYNINFRK